jgi:hypothetical protein
MQIYFPSLEAMEKLCRALFHEQCRHCQRYHQLISHGFVFKKQSGAESEQPVGKRVFCSDRNGRTGCGRTMQLYLDSTIRYLHYAGCCVVAFVLALGRGTTVQQAYEQATRTAEPRNAYRWLNRLASQLSEYRRWLHQPAFAPAETARVNPRRSLLASTFSALLAQFGQPLCAGYQRQLQRSLL